ncbi:MAG: diguanylate cyclase [Desulfobacterales bacterium]|nr:diguanylate cyclase [Desulfobacterales bacterium]
MDIKNEIDQSCYSADLANYTLFFADRISQIIKDMTNFSYTVMENSLKEDPIVFKNKMVVYIHFGGTIQGEYFLGLDELVGLNLLGDLGISTNNIEDIKEFKEDYSELAKEVLNIAVSHSVVELENIFGSLTIMSPILIFGDIVFPKIKSSSVDIIGHPGLISCAFSLNMVDSKISRKLKEMEKNLDKITKEATIDGLTQLYNRAFFDEIFRSTVVTSNRYKKPLSLIIIDVDYFKQINDTYGHQCGDKVLQAVSALVISHTRKADIPARYGGDELVIILSETPKRGASIVAERITSELRAKGVVYQQDGCETNVKVTLSVGIAQLRSDETHLEFFHRADEALYNSKLKGRNQIQTD